MTEDTPNEREEPDAGESRKVLRAEELFGESREI